MDSKEKREVLGAVRRGKKWRIPRPENLVEWEFQTREELRKLGVSLQQNWERDLEKLAKADDRYQLESYRLWLACYMKVVERSSISREARRAIILLWQTAGELLAPLPRHEMQVDKLKSRFPSQLLSLGLQKERVRAVMAYWPEDKHFRIVHSALTLNDLEAIRGEVDYWQAILVIKQKDEQPTAENVRPLLHKDFTLHINDTGEELPGIAVKRPSREQLRRGMLASACGQLSGKKPLRVNWDFRPAQNGLRLRTFRKLYPRKKKPQCDIIAEVYGIRDTIPSAEEKPDTGKTPKRGSAWSD